MTPGANDLCVFAVKRGYIAKKEIYCNSLYPFYLSLVEKLGSSKYVSGVIGDYVEINPKTDCSKLADDTMVSFVPMSNVQEKNNVVTYDMVPYSAVKKGFTAFKKGDMIWAKITPCMQNGKSCIVDDMPTEIGFGSTEFHVIRKHSNDLYMPYLWAVLSNDDVLKAAQATFSGSAGQQRVSATFIEGFPAVIPSYTEQVKLLHQIEKVLENNTDKRKQADELLKGNTAFVLSKLRLSLDAKEKRICYSSLFSSIEGRIDADYYSPKFMLFRKQIEEGACCPVSVGEICDRVITGFAAGKQDQADDLPDDQRVPHLRPFNITPEGELWFKVFKYVPKTGLRPEDYCQKYEILFNNTNSPDWVGKTTVFDQDVLCAASNHMTRMTLKDGVNPYYVAAFFNVLLSIGYWKLLCTNFNNQAGINIETLKKVRIPLPDISVQNEIAAEIMRRRGQANQLRKEAAKEWAEAKAQFERELLGK